jgi:hypothetical protein
MVTYVGYIMRSREHFGRSFVEATKASIQDFRRLTKPRDSIPEKYIEIQQKRAERIKNRVLPVSPVPEPVARNVDIYAEQQSLYKLPPNHPRKTFVSGYTGFVPRLQNHFGEVT